MLCVPKANRPPPNPRTRHSVDWPRALYFFLFAKHRFPLFRKLHLTQRERLDSLQSRRSRRGPVARALLHHQRAQERVLFFEHRCLKGGQCFSGEAESRNGAREQREENRSRARRGRPEAKNAFPRRAARASFRVEDTRGDKESSIRLLRRRRPQVGPSCSRIRSAIRPAFSRMACSILSAISGLVFKNALAFSRPWPSRTLSKENQAPDFSTTPALTPSVDQLVLALDTPSPYMMSISTSLSGGAILFLTTLTRVWLPTGPARAP